VTIYATDVDERALARARLAAYRPRAVLGLDTTRRRRYLVDTQGGYIVRPELRQAVVFGRQHLAFDPPLSRLDVVVCRHMLSYFNAEPQAQIVSKFHLALKSAGVLFLSTESLWSSRDLFTPLDARYAIFTKVPRQELVPLRVPAVRRRA